MLDIVSIACRSSSASAPVCASRANDAPQHPHDLVERVLPVRVEVAFECAAHGLGPRSEALGGEVADPPHLVDRAEVREQHEAVGGPLADALDRGERELEVVVGRRRRRSERARIRRVDAERVTGEDGARRGIRERDVVLGVARGRERLQVPRAQLDAVAVGERADPLDRNGFDGTEERPGGLATVDRRHARYQTRGVGQVSRAAFVHPDGRVREALGDPPYPARVVEVDVRDGDVRQVGRVRSRAARVPRRRVRRRCSVRSRRSRARRLRAGRRPCSARARRRTYRSR